MSRQVATALKVAFGLTLISLLVAQVRWRELTALVESGDSAALSLSLLAFVGALVGPQALRLHLLIRRHTGSLRVSYKLFFIGALFNNLLPSNVGGDAARLLYLRNMGSGGLGGPLLLLLLHRVSGLSVLLVAGGGYVVARGERLSALLIERTPVPADAFNPGALVSALVLVMAAVWLLWRSGRVRARLASLGRDAGAALRSLSAFDWSGLALLSVGFHAVRLLGFVWAADFLGQRVDPFDLVFVLSVAGVAALLPLSIAGLGVVEGSISVLLVGFGVAPTAAISVALVQRVSLLMVALAGGVVYFVTRGERAASAEAVT